MIKMVMCTTKYSDHGERERGRERVRKRERVGERQRKSERHREIEKEVVHYITYHRY